MANRPSPEGASPQTASPGGPAPGRVRILHSADWQIGKPYKVVGDPQKRFRLQEERLRCLGRIGAAARAQGASVVVVAGDLFDSTTVAISTALEVLEAIGAMALPVLVIPGNHDHGAPGGIWDSPDWQRHQPERAPNLQLLLERQPLELEQLVVLPCPLLRKQDASDPTGWIRSLDWATLPAGKPRLVVAHGSIQGFSGRDYGAEARWGSAPDPAGAGAMNRIDLEQLPMGELDYIALGDWHNLKQVSSCGSTSAGARRPRWRCCPRGASAGTTWPWTWAPTPTWSSWRPGSGSAPGTGSAKTCCAWSSPAASAWRPIAATPPCWPT